MKFVLVSSIILVICMISLGIVCARRNIIGKNMKYIAGINVAALFGILVFTTILLFYGSTVFAADPAEGASSSEGLRYIGAALSTGMSAIGAGIAVAMSSSAALGAISEDSRLLGKTLIFV